MADPYQGQSTAKTIFLLISAAGWLIVGASLIYLVPTAMDAFRPTEITSIWMETLSKGGYRPQLAIYGGGIAFIVTVAGNALWYQVLADRFETK